MLIVLHFVWHIEIEAFFIAKNHMNYDFRDSNDGDSHLFYTAFDTYIEFIYMGAFKQQHFSNNAQCPVGACGAPLNEDDEMEQCEGPCHGMYDVDTMVALPCCQVS